ncbi:MAG: ABC transporter substrate-binding protein [Chloroflexi bacterium]|nr:ABC transporter substrate-binding protein [Chloroflexota bacterium]
MPGKVVPIGVGFIALVGLLLPACAPAEPTPRASPSPQAAKPAPSPEAKASAPAATAKVEAEAARYGGTLTSYIALSLPNLDPQQGAGEVGISLAAMYSNLIQVDTLSADKWAPGLAEKWELSRDGTVWTFDIRQGVKFHDGTPFTADDAVFTLKRLTDPPTGIVSNVGFLLRPVVKSVDKEGNKVKLTQNYPFAALFDALAHNFSPAYSEKHVAKYGDMKTTAMGTGPFKFKSYTPGVVVEGVRNPDFWVKGRPYLDGYRVLMLRDEATRISAFRTGKVEMTGKATGAMTPNQMESLAKDNPGLKFYPSTTLTGSWFFMNTRKPPFQDQRVRKAVSLALDRQAAIKVVARGQGLIGQPFPRDPWSIPEADLLKMPGYRQPKDADIGEAKKLMQTAGYSDGFDLSIYSRQPWQFQDAATFMTNQLAPLGIRAKVNIPSDADFWDIGRRGGHDAMVYTCGFFTPDPQWMGRFWVPGGALNFAGNEDDQELIKMWDEQIRADEPVQRSAIIRRVAERVLDSLPGAPIVWYRLIHRSAPGG